MARKKLIEVALPLEAINAQSAREKEPFTRNHPRSLHIWWARRPLATARAILFAQLVDDPSNDFEKFRQDGIAIGVVDAEAFAQERVGQERERLFDLIAQMVDWDNRGDVALFDAVKREIARSTDGNPPTILDPFAGGGTIPVEAQRLGLVAHASDLNPVAVLINKALVEMPTAFTNQHPVFPAATHTRTHWPLATGLAEDVRRYGAWLVEQAQERVGSDYPKVELGDGSHATPIAWMWARTVVCPNPACAIELPLVRSWWLSKKKGKEAYIVPSVNAGKVVFDISHDVRAGPVSADDGTVGRLGARCISCSTGVALAYVRAQARLGKLGNTLMAVAAQRGRDRLFIPPSDEQTEAARVEPPVDLPQGRLPEKALSFRVQAYGMLMWTDLFTARQLKVLCALSDLVDEVRDKVVRDYRASKAQGGSDPIETATGDAAEAYADAVATYLGLAVSRYTDMSNSLVSWNVTNQNVRALFARQSIPMVWDFPEVNPFGSISLEGPINAAAASIETSSGPAATVSQADAASRSYESLLISTDPPYYDNIGYSDLSDFFYVWLRRSLRSVHPDLLSTMLVPKAEELVANPYRHGGRDGAQVFFEDGFRQVFAEARKAASDSYPITVYYAFKQSELDADGTASTGWETLLSGMVQSGWTITATWPVRSERAGRMISLGTNALASSIVLALRPRPENAPTTDRRGFLVDLRSSLPEALRNLQQGSIAPVDMAQAAIGPGMATFSRYARVVEPSGQPMSVRDALRAINGVLDEVLSQQEGDFDDDTRWCIAWFETHGFDVSQYGDAETLASAKNASVAGLARSGVISSGGGKVKLFTPDELPAGYDPRADDRISLWEVVLHMARALSDSGLDAAGRILAGAEERGIDMTAAHELAYLLYAISEKRGLTQAGILFNTLGSSWPEVRAAAASAGDRPVAPTAPTLDFDDLEF